MLLFFQYYVNIFYYIIIQTVMETNESIGDRLRLLMDYYSLNKNSLSVKLGLQGNSVIVRIVNDPTRGISYEMLQRIGDVFEEVEW